MKKIMIAFLLLAGLLTTYPAVSQTTSAKAPSATPIENKQLILWASGDREVALKMVFMYAANAKKFGWKDNVRILIWGPSSKLAATDPGIQERMKQLQAVGVEIFACRACADEYGVTDKLSEHGIKVLYAGEMLANARREGWDVLSI